MAPNWAPWGRTPMKLVIIHLDHKGIIREKGKKKKKGKEGEGGEKGGKREEEEGRPGRSRVHIQLCQQTEQCQ